MITYVEGDIFESSADCLVNPVNVVGVMGGGLALEFKLRYPKMYDYYRVLCFTDNFDVGEVKFWMEDKWICLFPTKNHWRNPSTVEIVSNSLDYLLATCPREIKTIAFPKVGCGLGGLNFDTDVKPIMEAKLQTSELDCFVYI